MNRAGRRANGERGRFKDPVNKRRSEPVGARAADDACSWLGQWSGVGWSIRIEPKMSTEQWDAYGRRAGEAWDNTIRRYDPMKTLEILGSLFPTHTFALTWPTCGYRTRTDRPGKVPLFVMCGAQAQHTETHLTDVHGDRIAIARCDEHQGQL